MMNLTYKLGYQLVTYVILISSFLPSCSTVRNSFIPSEAGQTNTMLLVDKQWVAPGGHIVSLYQEGKQLHAIVKENVPTGFSRIHDRLNVYLATDMQVALLANLNENNQKRLIAVKLPTSNQLGYVYIGSRGLQGGMQRNARGEEKRKKNRGMRRNK